jgi:hypothetical protein
MCFWCRWEDLGIYLVRCGFRMGEIVILTIMASYCLFIHMNEKKFKPKNHFMKF